MYRDATERWCQNAFGTYVALGLLLLEKGPAISQLPLVTQIWLCSMPSTQNPYWLYSEQMGTNESPHLNHHQIKVNPLTTSKWPWNRGHPAPIPSACATMQRDPMQWNRDTSDTSDPQLQVHLFILIDLTLGWKACTASKFVNLKAHNIFTTGKNQRFQGFQQSPVQIQDPNPWQKSKGRSHWTQQGSLDFVANRAETCLRKNSFQRLLSRF